MLFYFLCVITCLSLALRKKLLNLPKKMFQRLGWMRKNFIPAEENFVLSWSVAAETWDASCFKKGLLENNRMFQTLAPYCHWKNILSKLNKYIFQIPLKYIKLVIPKILFVLVLCLSGFYFKVTWPSPSLPPTKLPLSTKIKIPEPHLPPPQERTFWNF